MVTPGRSFRLLTDKIRTRHARNLNVDWTLGMEASGTDKTGKAGGYRVLARKYRPRDFSGLIGQEPMVRTLTNAFEAGRIAQAWMLTGVRGVGKTTTARILARALNYKTDTIDKPTIELKEPGIHIGNSAGDCKSARRPCAKRPTIRLRGSPRASSFHAQKGFRRHARHHGRIRARPTTGASQPAADVARPVRASHHG